MKDEKMIIKVVDENGKEIECEIITTFKDENSDINYIVYTDGTKDEEGDLEIYASRFVLEDNNFILVPIENDYEWDLIDNLLKLKIKEVGE